MPRPVAMPLALLGLTLFGVALWAWTSSVAVAPVEAPIAPAETPATGPSAGQLFDTVLREPVARPRRICEVRTVDQAGDPVVDVEVTLCIGDEKRVATTDASGTSVWSVPRAGAGRWRVLARHRELFPLGEPEGIDRVPASLRIVMARSIPLRGVVRHANGTPAVARLAIATAVPDTSGVRRLESRVVASTTHTGTFDVRCTGPFTGDRWIVAFANGLPAAWRHLPAGVVPSQCLELVLQRGDEFRVRFIDRLARPVPGLRAVVMSDCSAILPEWHPDDQRRGSGGPRGLRVIESTSDENGILHCTGWPAEAFARLRIFGRRDLCTRVAHVDSGMARTHSTALLHVGPDAMVTVTVDVERRVAVKVRGVALDLTPSRRARVRVLLDLGTSGKFLGRPAWTAGGCFEAKVFVPADRVRGGPDAYLVVEEGAGASRYGPYQITDGTTIDGIRLRSSSM